jgi:Rod binding domain-containing protein
MRTEPDAILTAVSSVGLNRPQGPRDDGRHPLVTAQRSFASILARDRGAPADPEQSARESAEQLVSISLVQPVLKQLRDSDGAAPPFAPTQAERQFRSLMDAELAQRLVRASNFPLVDRLARDLLARAPATDGVRPDGNQDAQATPATDG